MKRVFTVGILLMLLQFTVAGQSVEQSVEIETPDGVLLKGTLLLPSLDQDAPVPVAVIVAGSGPTDRDGNNPMMINNSLKMLAEALMQQGIASLRYDKRGIRASASAMIKESDIQSLDIFADDVRSWVDYVADDDRFDDVILIGHSEGARLSMRAILDGAKADQLILLAGAGRPMQALLKEQLATQPEQIKNISYAIIDTLVSGKKYDSVPVFLNSLFRPSMQPALISEFKVRPARMASKIKIPMLIVQGTTDIQVSVRDAELLSEANSEAHLELIENMNHVLKECAVMDKMQQMMYYTNPTLELHKELIPKIMNFLNPLIGDELKVDNIAI